MKHGILPLVSLVSLFLLPGCDRRPTAQTLPPEPTTETKTMETSRLGDALDAYQRSPSAENQAAVRKAMADLDGEIAELQTYIANHEGSARDVAASKLQNLQSYRNGQAVRFAMVQGQAAVAGGGPAADARSAADKMEGSIEKAGQKVEDAAQKAGEHVEDAAKQAGDAIKDAGK